MADDIQDILNTSTVWNIGIDWSTSPARQLDMSRTILELSTSRVSIIEISDNLRLDLQYSLTSMNSEEICELITFFNGRLGRFRRFWVPVYFRRFTLTQDANILDTTLTVKNTNFAAFSQGYERLIIYMNNGDRVVRGISSAINLGGGEESLSLMTPLYRNISYSDIASCFLLIMGRFTNDELGLNFKTDTTAQATINISELVREYTIEGVS